MACRMACPKASPYWLVPLTYSWTCSSTWNRRIHPATDETHCWRVSFKWTVAAARHLQLIIFFKQRALQDRLLMSGLPDFGTRGKTQQTHASSLGRGKESEKGSALHHFVGMVYLWLEDDCKASCENMDSSSCPQVSKHRRYTWRPFGHTNPFPRYENESSFENIPQREVPHGQVRGATFGSCLDQISQRCEAIVLSQLQRHELLNEEKRSSPPCDVLSKTDSTRVG